jgi:formylglycine-generating enzyme required for sulfatase activity
VQFCNFLTSGDKSKGAYQFTGDNTNPGDFLSINRTAAIAIYGTIYVLPTENEWYKAAYYKPDGSGYSLYANGQNTVPAAGNGWNYGSINPPWDVGTGTQEQNGTFDIMGNVIEWNETAMYDGSCCVLRGGSYWARNLGSGDLASYTREGNPPDGEGNLMGFRIASIVPEPCSAVLFALGGLALLRRKRFV